MSLTVTDMFCGAGGQSIAAEAAGARLRMGLNHWARAIETHNTNFAHADHDCADISQADPRRYPATDILCASPECTNHSNAKGKRRATSQGNLFGGELPDEAAERSRATMWDVPRFAECHRYRLIVCENVVEASKWVMWDAWLHAMDCLGYRAQVVSLNSQHVGVPQSRDRIYVVFTRKADRRPDLSLTPRAHCPRCEVTVEAQQGFKPGRLIGKYRSQYGYHCPACLTAVEPDAPGAWSIIDWTLPAQRIGERERPLSAKTMARIARGLELIRERRAALMGLSYGGKEPRPVEDPMATMTARHDQALVTDGCLVPAGGPSVAPRHTDAPMPAVMPRERMGLLTAMVDLRGTNAPRHVEEPVSTVAASGNHHGLLSALLPYYGNSTPSHALDPVPTVTGRDRHALLTAAPLSVEDCTFRMLQPAELQAAMAFPADYAVTGNKREQVMQLGNAVTPPAVQHLLTRSIAAVFG